MKMNPEISAVLIPVFFESGYHTPRLLEVPTTPEIVDTSLVPRRANDSQRMQIHGAFNDIDGSGIFAVAEDRVAFQQTLFK